MKLHAQKQAGIIETIQTSSIIKRHSHSRCREKKNNVHVHVRRVQRSDVRGTILLLPICPGLLVLFTWVSGNCRGPNRTKVLILEHSRVV